jgi:hypothetical protein
MIKRQIDITLNLKLIYEQGLGCYIYDEIKKTNVKITKIYAEKVN